MRYKAWGETRFTSGSTPTTFRFTGQRQEEQLGLYFYNARWYDPALGRFIQADTVVPGLGNSQAWDRYAYVSNNPVKFIDPTGHVECIDEECKLALHPKSERIIEFRGNVGDKERYKIIWGSDLDKELDSTVLEKALQGNIWSIIDLLLPTHVGGRGQGEVSIPVFGVFGISVTPGAQLTYNRVTNQWILHIDVSGNSGPGIGGGGSVTIGPIVGWGASEINTITSGWSGQISGSAAAKLAGNVTISTPLPFRTDPHYGVFPTTLYLGIGAGAGYANLGLGGGKVFIRIK